ncbi:hypothetical protein F7725_027887 [Dissostichus mawsoni]|uniref:Secreted protein n=1 Tax=Dissostichus mawsoni TaxID=36200 RepID=A0A7J5XF74_DISMA|nr:hypothetical protein F7725_027887 [Dissostichus mawsoni]
MRASGRLMQTASLSLMLTSGYCVCWKAFSRACSCDTVKAVRLRRCFCWFPYRASRISSGWDREKHKSYEDPPASLSATDRVCTAGLAAEYTRYCSAIWWRRSNSMAFTPWRGNMPPPLDIPQNSRSSF